IDPGDSEAQVGQLLAGARREPAPATVATRINCGYRRFVTLRPVKVNCELLPSDGDVAVFSNDVRPRLRVVRIVVIWRHRLLRRDPDHDDEESNAQQNPTMNEAACFHVLILS